jgi:hypothetical protein
LDDFGQSQKLSGKVRGEVLNDLDLGSYDHLVSLVHAPSASRVSREIVGVSSSGWTAKTAIIGLLPLITSGSSFCRKVARALILAISVNGTPLQVLALLVLPSQQGQLLAATGSSPSLTAITACRFSTERFCQQVGISRYDSPTQRFLAPDGNRAVRSDTRSIPSTNDRDTTQVESQKTANNYRDR